jgi:hypothetical protein
MSDNFLVLIPTDPHWQPDDAAAERAGAVIADLAPEAEEIEGFITDEVEFFDAGENLETVSCPFCATEVSDWWADSMDAAADLGFADLTVVMPCCGKPASLNDLIYDMPQGFAQFSISVTEPAITELSDEAVRRIGEALGHPVRAIWQRY